MTTPPPPEDSGLADTIARSVVAFPRFLAENIGGLILAILVDWNTTMFVIATGVLAYVTDPVPVIAVAAILYVVLRILGEAAGTVAQQINFLGRVQRDKVNTVNITQLPEVLVRQAKQLDEIDRLREAGAMGAEPNIGGDFCNNCGTPLPPDAVTCEACGR